MSWFIPPPSYLLFDFGQQDNHTSPGRQNFKFSDPRPFALLARQPKWPCQICVWFKNACFYLIFEKDNLQHLRPIINTWLAKSANIGQYPSNIILSQAATDANRKTPDGWLFIRPQAHSGVTRPDGDLWPFVWVPSVSQLWRLVPGPNAGSSFWAGESKYAIYFL